MKLNTVTLTAPSAWACYLINGDATGLEDGEEAQIEAWLNYVGLGAPVSCEDAGFRWHHDADTFADYGADCQEYVFLTEEIQS